MQRDKLSRVVEVLRRRRWLAILIAVHLPFMVGYLRGLWWHTHYQFFPFAIGAFVWMFATRRSGEPEQWTWPIKILIAVDVVCLAAQGYQYSPWLAAVGLVALLTAWCFASRDTGYDRRLTSLALLPLLVVRLPLMYDEQLIHWLQRLTTSFASSVMHRLEMLHFREGNVLQFPGKSFMVEEACSGVQSLFTILFLAALVICLKRRSVIHGTVLLAAGFFFAGVMNTLRVFSVAFAWDKYATDLSSGISHDVLGYICLAVAALMLMSADAFLGFLSDPVMNPFQPEAADQFFQNPLIRLWNRLVAVVPSSTGSKAIHSTQASTRQDSDRGSDAEHPEYLSSRELLKPRYWFRFGFELLECWHHSRSFGQLVAGMPFLVATVGFFFLIGWLRHASDAPIIAACENAFNTASGDDQETKREIYLRALNSLRPLDFRYRFRLGEYLFKQGRKNEGLSEIVRLAPETGVGHADARMWLVRQSMQPEPVQPLSLDQIEKQLHAVVQQVPTQIEAHQLLAQLYADRGEWNLAEEHLSHAASISPELNLALARLRKRRNTSPNDLLIAAQRAVVTLSEQLEKNRANSNLRVELAEAMVLAGREASGREVLVSGLMQQKDDPVLTHALSEFDLMIVDRQLTESSLNRDVSVPVVAAALERDPSNVIAVQMLVRLQSMGAEISGVSLQMAVDYWQKEIKETPDDKSRILLSQILLLSGDPENAAETMQPALDQHPELRLNFARLLKQSGKTEKSANLLNVLIRESQSRLEQDPKDTAAATQLGEALLVLGRPEDARQLLITFADDPATSRIPTDAGLAALYGWACLGCYDSLTESNVELRRPTDAGSISTPAAIADSTASDSEPQIATNVADASPSRVESQEPAVLLGLLADAVACRSTTNQAIDRISRLSLSSHPAADGAESLVRQLRLEGPYGGQVLNLLGMHALLMNRLGKATSYLELANIQTRGRDPMILNNLALAIIRSDEGPKGKALDRANETLALLPDHPDALATRGEIYVAMERWPEAIADLTESLKLRSTNAEVHRLLEKAYTGLPDPQMAEEHRQRASELEAAEIADLKTTTGSL